MLVARGTTVDWAERVALANHKRFSTRKTSLIAVGGIGYGRLPTRLDRTRGLRSEP